MTPRDSFIMIFGECCYKHTVLKMLYDKYYAQTSIQQKFS